jgi:hypothetical protein
MNKEQNRDNPVMRIIIGAAVAGNILFILWILFNGINEGFQGTIIEKISYISLMGLMAVNAFLLIRNQRQQKKNN